VGDYVPSYASTKCGGVKDSVAVGKTVCYTCRAGQEPIFYVFAAKRSDALAKLVREIESLVAAHREQKAAAVINFLGDPKNESARTEVAQFGQQHGLHNVSLTITGDSSKFDLDPADEATVILFERNFRLRNSVKAGQLNEKAIQLISRRAKGLLE
jgi:hypothetical protein